MTTTDRIIQSKNLREEMIELANINLQKLRWLSGNSRAISSYVELISALFDGFDIEGFIKSEYFVRNHSESIKGKFELLVYALNEYEPLKAQAEILSDSKWLMICNQAQDILMNWPLESE
jgi:hypothetical protein